MRSFRWACLLTAATMGMILVAVPSVPLGIPGEWEWSRHDLPATLIDWCDRLLAPLAGAVLVIGIAVAGGSVLRKPGFFRVAGMLLLLCLTSLLWQRLVVMAAPSPHREVKSLWINYDKYASGYFFEAVFRIPSAAALLTGYEDRMREGDVLHVGTHPPGLFLFSWCALQATHSSPSLVRILELTRDRTAESLFRQIEYQARFARPLHRTELAALQLIAFITEIFAAAAVVPLFLLSICVFERRVSWWAACCFVTIPTVSIFFPKSDVLYLLTTTTFLWLSVCSLTAEVGRIRGVTAVAAGIVLSGSLLFSLAHLPAVVAVVVFAALRSVTSTDESRMAGGARLNLVARMVRPGGQAWSLGLLFGAFLLCVIAWNAATSCNLFRVWQLNLTNHAGFYGQSPRTWWKWVLLNPLELGLAAGLPLFTTGVAGGCVSMHRVTRAVRAILRSSHAGTSAICRVSVGDCLTTALCLTWILLWLSGKNLGEAARLWCFLTPWVVIAAAGTDAAQTVAGAAVGPESSATLSRATAWRILLILQLITAIVTVGRVNGFSI